MRIVLFTGIFVFTSCVLVAQGIRGHVLSASGDTLPFASVFIPKSGKGVSGNTHGYYELKLEHGTHKVVSQYVGYRNKEVTVDISDSWKTVNFVLSSSASELKMVEVRPGDEDPAYTIMRKAIAKSKYHLMMYDSYFCRVYTKGTGMITEAPLLIRKQLERDNIDLNRAFTTESMSEIHFRQPDSLHEKVVAIRKVGNDVAPSPNAFINASFYKPMIAGAVSPLAPSALFYYKFGYRGSFEEDGHTIFKISVVPKTRGEDTYSGFIYIIDGLYAIHSLELQTYLSGFEVKVNQLYQPVKEDCWMPVNHRIYLKGKIMGVALQYDYVANVDDYQVVLNEFLRAKQINLDKDQQAGSREDVKTEEITDKKTLRRELKRFEKKQSAEQEDKSVVRHRSMQFDSAVYDMEEELWQQKRPIPLTEAEVDGYKVADSIAGVEESGGDTTKTFRLSDVFFGKRYRLSKKTQLRWHSPVPMLGFNTVEGMVAQGRLSGQYRLDSLHMWSLRGDATYRYGNASNTHYYKGRVEIFKDRRYSEFSLALSGGQFVRQFNREEPISELVNSIHTLVFRENYIKLYQDTYLRLSAEKSFQRKLEVSGGVEVSERSPLTNNTDYSFFFTNTRAFTDNQPEGAVPMPAHRALLSDIKLRYRPLLKYMVRGRVKQPLMHQGDPVFYAEYRNGVYDLGSAFHHLRGGYTHEVRFGVSGTLEWNLSGGTFFGTTPQFPDARHFMGNQTFFIPFRDMDHFRLMPYYDYSTSGTYGQLMTRYTFRKLLVTQFFYPRMMGATEQFFLNGMMSENGNQYLEVGYSLQNLYRIFRIDLGTSLHPETGRFGIMIGLGGVIQFE